MKKILALTILVLSFACANAQYSSPRFSTSIGGDNTGQALTWKYLNPTYTSIYFANPNAYKTIVKMDTLNGAQTDSVSIKNSHIGDEIVFIYQSDATSGGRTVTFGNHLITSAATLVVDSIQKATISFIFDGVAWIETGRAKQ